MTNIAARPSSRINFLMRILAACCITGMILSYPIWISTRDFPLIPLFHFIPVIPSPADRLVFYATIILLLISCIVKDPRRPLLGFLVMAIVLCITDQNRLQPWFYQYCLMIGIYCILAPQSKKNNESKVLIIFSIMISAIYFWSGLQKLNIHFTDETFPWLMEPITKHLPTGATGRFKFLGNAFPFIETLTGILLLTRWKRSGMILAVLMHLFILFVLSPLGHNYNPVVWPWNIAMICFNLILFSSGERLNLGKIRSAFDLMPVRILVIIFVMMPLFNFFNAWDSYLSHNLYSGNTAGGSLYVTDSVKARLPKAIQPYATGQMNQNQINIKYWCMQVTGVPAYPEKRIFEAVRDSVYKYATDSSEILLVVQPKLKLKDM